MFAKYEVIIVRGAPGIGKSTIGELLKTSNFAGAVLDIDELRAMINSERFIYNENSHYFNAIDVASGLIDTLLNEDVFPIFVLDVFSDTILNHFEIQLRCKNILIINLYCQDEVLTKRMNNRKNGFVNTDVAKKINKQMQIKCNNANLLIDTTHFNPKSVLKQIESNVFK